LILDFDHLIVEPEPARDQRSFHYVGKEEDMRRARRRRIVRRSFLGGSWVLTAAIILIVLLGAGFLCRLVWLAR